MQRRRRLREPSLFLIRYAVEALGSGRPKGPDGDKTQAADSAHAHNSGLSGNRNIHNRMAGELVAAFGPDIDGGEGVLPSFNTCASATTASPGADA